MFQNKTIDTPNPYDIESKVEGSHWWFSARRKILKSFLLSIFKLPNNIALDVGCGTGSNLKVLKSEGFLGIGLDKSSYALKLIKNKKDHPLLLGDLTMLPIHANSIGLVIAMDVFEHLDRDEEGFAECYRVLNQGGLIFITVPAFKFLWGRQDRLTGHKRRYTKKEIKNKLKQIGFDILKLSYFNFFLFFPILIVRRVISLVNYRRKSENELNCPLMNSLFKILFSFEILLSKYISLPLGVSILCAAQKR